MRRQITHLGSPPLPQCHNPDTIAKMGRTIIIKRPPPSEDEMHNLERASRVRVENEILNGQNTDIIKINNAMLPPHFIDRPIPAHCCAEHWPMSAWTS